MIDYLYVILLSSRYFNLNMKLYKIFDTGIKNH